jgi:hypothetical protein
MFRGPVTVLLKARMQEGPGGQKVAHKILFWVPTLFMKVREFYPSLRVVGLNLRAMNR